MAEDTKKMMNQEPGDIINKGTDDKSVKGDVMDVFSEEQKAELGKIVQSNVDKTATKLKKEYESRIEGLQRELDLSKQATMTEAEKAQLEKDNYLKMKQDFDKERLSFELSKKIVDAGLPIQFADVWLKPPKNIEELESRLDDAKSLFGGYKSQVLEGYRKDNVRVPEGAKNITSNIKVIKREAFEVLNPTEKKEFIQSGGKLE